MYHKIITVPLHVNNKSDDFVIFLERIEKLRDALSLTKDEVYSRLKISQPMISMIRSGQRTPSIKMKRRIAAAELAAGLAAPTPAPPAVFQTLEKGGSDFPNLGKKDADFSKPWKNAPDFFQALEKRLAALEENLAEVLRLLRERK
jgi:transcriptional regulator with XRE-family HTH domain